jgi:glycosyltransferase involved in cell wall biosynthesis
MKIFQLIPTLDEGGAERFVVDLSNALIENYSCQVVLIVFFKFDRNQFLVKELNRCVEIVELNKKTGLDLTLDRKLYRLIREHKPDVIHTHLNTFDYMFFNIFRFKRKITFVQTIHNSPNFIYNNKIVRGIHSILFRINNVNPVIISTNSNPEFKNLFPGINPNLIFNGRPNVKPSNQIEIVREEVASYKKTPRSIVFINVARISAQKNQMLLIEAFNGLIDEGEDIVLLIVGKHWDKEIVKKMNEKIKDRIHLLGYKDNPVDYLSCSDAFCLSSFYEGMPISLIEAIQYGVIPICTPAGGVKDIIKSSFGFVSDDFSITSYIESLKSFLKLDEAKRSEMSSKAKLDYEHNYTMKITSSKYYQLYKS